MRECVDQLGDSEDIQWVKREMRRHIAELRSQMDPREQEQRDAAIAQQFLGSDLYQMCSVLYSYLSIGREIDTHAIIEAAWRDSKTVALPRCTPKSHEMRWYVVSSYEGLIQSSFGVWEPDPQTMGELVLPVELLRPQSHLAVIPGLMFDIYGYRLGYGGGFYDTFLGTFCGVSVGLAAKAQMVSSLAKINLLEPHDLPVDYIATESAFCPAV